MSRSKKRIKKFRAYVSQLGPDECREQLVRSFLLMERCVQVMRGENVEPIEVNDRDDVSDLELFYMCKKLREECDYLVGVAEQELHENAARYLVSVDIASGKDFDGIAIVPIKKD